MFLESLIYNDTCPRIALILAQSSITLNDFEDGIRAAKVQLDFEEFRVTFTKTTELISTLNYLDEQGYNAIAMVRGGGIDPKTDIDKPEVIEAVTNLKTPFIAATGHKDEVIFLRQVADKWTATPQGLGQYFSELVESVSEKKSKSRAAITEQIKKQFQQQLEAGKKQNKELQEKLAKLTKAQEEAIKKHNEQVAAIQKQNKEQNEKTVKQNEELQKQLKEINKANEAAQKAHTEQLTKLQQQLKSQTEPSSKQSKEFNESLNKMQETNRELQKSLSTLTAQNTKTQQDLNAAKEQARILQTQLDEARNKNKGCSGCMPIVAAIITITYMLISYL